MFSQQKNQSLLRKILQIGINVLQVLTVREALSAANSHKLKKAKKHLPIPKSAPTLVKMEQSLKRILTLNTKATSISVPRKIMRIQPIQEEILF